MKVCKGLRFLIKTWLLSMYPLSLLTGTWHKPPAGLLPLSSSAAHPSNTPPRRNNPPQQISASLLDFKPFIAPSSPQVKLQILSRVCPPSSTPLLPHSTQHFSSKQSHTASASPRTTQLTLGARHWLFPPLRTPSPLSKFLRKFS